MTGLFTGLVLMLIPRGFRMTGCFTGGVFTGLRLVLTGRMSGLFADGPLMASR